MLKGFRLTIFFILIFSVELFAGDGPDSICRMDKTEINMSEAFKALLKGIYPAECAEFWMQNLSRLEKLYETEGNYDGIEILVTAQGSDIESFFGHGQIRFVGTGKTPREDLVLGFEAQIIPSDAKSFFGIPVYIKGIFGGYRAVPVLRTIDETWNLYSFKKNRPTYRFIIPSNPTLRKNLINTIKEWMQNINKNESNPLQSYAFISKNCITLLMKLIEDSGFAFSGSLGGAYSKSKIKWKLNTGIQGIMTPHDAFYILRQELLNPYLPLIISSPKFNIEKLIATLHRNLDQRIGISHETTVTVGEFSALPNVLYQLCENQQCGEEVKSASREIWRHSSINLKDQDAQIIYDDEWRLAFRERLEAYQEYLNRYQELNLVDEAKQRLHYNHWRILLDTVR